MYLSDKPKIYDFDFVCVHKSKNGHPKMTVLFDYKSRGERI